MERDDLNKGYYEAQGFQQPPKKKRRTGLTVFLIILGVFLALIALGGIAFVSFDNSSSSGYNLSDEHLSVIYITGTIENSGEASVYEKSSYNQEWLIDTIEAMTYENQNKGIILYLDTPGGSVYATDEVYLKLMDYKEFTGNPIYAIMGPTCASGGYYISCAADKIFANRNTVTGSIGVTMGSLIDISGLLEKYGIKTTPLVSGRNKGMGSIYEPPTAEQIAIYQSIIDESYAQFTEIVADGRNMDINKVKELADGRIYTAAQALNNGLIDEICSYEDAILSIQEEPALENCSIYEYYYAEEFSLLDFIFGISERLERSSKETNELSKAIALAEGSSIKPYYIFR